jgi:hypothetical protein
MACKDSGMDNMARNEKLVDQRNHKRFLVRDSAFVVIRAPWPSTSKVGQIVDISMSGLGFWYIASEERPNESPALEIVLPRSTFRLDKIPFESISDFETANEDHLSSMTMRRSGVQFGELTRYQISRLNYFIQNYTIAEMQVDHSAQLGDLIFKNVVHPG